MAMENIIKKRILFFIKIVITATILFLILRKINFPVLLHNFSSIGFSTMILLILTTCVKLYTQYFNWGTLLKLNPDYKPKRAEILKSYFIGDALRFLIPGGYGTFGKIYFVNNLKKATAFSIGIEKFFQIWINLFFASFASIFYFRNVNLFLKLMLFLLILFAPFILYLFFKIIKKKKIRIYSKRYLKITPQIIGMQVLHNFITFFQYFLILKSFITIGFMTVCIAVSLILVANIIPITYAGLGLRETFAIQVLSKFNISPEIAVAASLTIFFINLVLPAFVGLIFIIQSRKILKVHLPTK